MISLTFIDAEGESTVVQAKVGETLLDIAHENDIEIEGKCIIWFWFNFLTVSGACGGELACSTCHCILEPQVYAKLEPPTEEEEDMLDLAWGLTDTSRLGCQIKATKELEGILIRIPDESNDMS